MSGGGRRPPSTRHSSPARDSRRSDTPPARRNLNGNAGYAAISHGSNGRFTSKASAEFGNANPGSCHFRVQQHANIQAPQDAQVTVSMEESSQADSLLNDSRNVCEQQHANIQAPQDAQGTVAMEETFHASQGTVAKASSPRRQDENMQSTVLHCMQDVCGNSPVHMQGQSALEMDGGSSVNQGGIDINCQKAPFSFLNHVSDVCMDSGRNEIPTLHGNYSQPIRMHSVCHNASSKQHTGSAVPNAWKKQGVVPLPSLQDLGNPPSHNGAAQLDAVEVNGYMDRFQSALVGRLFGRHFPFYHLNNELHRRWDGFGSFKLLTLSNDCFICFFEEIAVRDAILMSGPWILAGQVIGLDVWTPSFSPSTMHGFVTPIWIRFPGLPLYCWGRNSITRIASLLGEPIWIDNATAEMSRASYARVCIKADLSKPLASSVCVLGLDGSFQQPVEYEGLATLCFRCGRVGHKDIKCPSYNSPSSKTHVNSSPPAAANNIHSTASDNVQPHALKVSDDGYGPWMVVQHRRRKPAPPMQPKLKWVSSSRNNDRNDSVKISEPDKIQVEHSPSLLAGKDSSISQVMILDDKEVGCPPLKQPQQALEQADPTSDLHDVPKAAMIFSSTPSPNLAVQSGGARLSHTGKVNAKMKGSIGRTKQILYDVGPLTLASHKKRKPSIQSNGEDASSSAPG